MSIVNIGKWNYMRNGLKFDAELERSMLFEEEVEFAEGMKAYFEQMTCDNLFKAEFVTDAVVEMVDAYCDFMYVYTGTCIKSIGMGNNFVIDCSHKQSLMNSVLQEILVIHGVKLYDKRKAELPFIEQCYSYVMDANDKKPITKTKGKVVKGNTFVDPKHQIKELLLDRGFLASPDEALERYRNEIAEKVDVSNIVPVNNLVGADVEGA